MKNVILDNPKPTVGVFEQRQDLERDGVALHVKYCDTAGLEAYRAMSQVYLNNAQGTSPSHSKQRRIERTPMSSVTARGAGVMVVYDIANLESFEHCKAWIQEVKDNVSGPRLRSCPLHLLFTAVWAVQRY